MHPDDVAYDASDAPPVRTFEERRQGYKDLHESLMLLESRLTTAINLTKWGLGVSGSLFVVMVGILTPVATANHDRGEDHERRIATMERRGKADHLVCHRQAGQL